MERSKRYRSEEKEILPWIRKRETHKFTFFNVITFFIGLLLLGLSLILVSVSYGGERKHNKLCCSEVRNSDKSSRLEIYDKDWNRKGYIKRDSTTWDTIYNEKNERIGYIKDGAVFDKDWNRKLNIK